MAGSATSRAGQTRRAGARRRHHLIGRDQPRPARLPPQGTAFASIPARGRIVPLRATPNTATGGPGRDVPDEFHPDTRRIVEAAARPGFPKGGTSRQHMTTKGRNRDTAWYSIIDSEWPALSAAFGAWLAPDNFDSSGVQRTSLSDLTAALVAHNNYTQQKAGD